MSRYLKYSLVIAILAAGMFVAGDLFASTVQNDAFGSDEIVQKADNVMSFLFGPVMRFAGVLGAGVGVIWSMIGQSIKPLLTFGGIGLAVGLVPSFINGVFSLLLQ